MRAMSSHFAQLKALTVVLTMAVIVAYGSGCAVGASSRGNVATPDGSELGRIQAAIVAALAASPPRGYAPIPDGVRLLSISRQTGGRIVIDFSRELLAAGTGRPLEDALHQILLAASAARTPAAGRVDDYRVLVDGTELERYVP